MQNDSNTILLADVLPCARCGEHEQRFESAMPEGRQAEVWRVLCVCGNASEQWSVSKRAAARLWNRYMAESV